MAQAALPLTLSIQPLRFHFRALDPIFFPPGKAGNVIRGALGNALPNHAALFAPKAPEGEGPSGLSDPPRPFVLRADHLDATRVEPGTDFTFTLNLFDTREPTIAAFSDAFASLANRGLGNTRGRAKLLQIERPLLTHASLTQGPEVSRIIVQFETPTELKHDGAIAKQPHFGILFARIRDRISTLRAAYGPGPLDIDFASLGAQADAIQMTRCDIAWNHAERRSSRTGQTHTIGGFTGEAEYEGDLTPFVPYLNAAYWTGVGRQTVWGKGRITTRPVSPDSARPATS